jgi:hypothetical protein
MASGGFAVAASARARRIRAGHGFNIDRTLETTMSEERPPRAEQQGDGQPENARELEDAAGGSALADRGRAADAGRAGSAPGAGASVRRDGDADAAPPGAAQTR